MNLYNLTLAAESEVSTYRSADIDEWRSAIDPVLKAAGECAVGSDKVDDISNARLMFLSHQISPTKMMKGCNGQIKILMLRLILLLKQ